MAGEELPTRREDREQALLRMQAEEKGRHQEEREAHLLATKGKEIAAEIDIRMGHGPDEALRTQARDLAIKNLAESKTLPEQYQTRPIDYARLLDQSIREAYVAEEKRATQEAAATKQAEQKSLEERANQTREQEAQTREQEAKEKAAFEQAKREPIPGVIERFNAVVAEKKQAITQETAIQEYGERASGRRRYDELKSVEPDRNTPQRYGQKDDKDPGKGEMSDRRQSRFGRMFEKSDRSPPERDDDTTREQRDSERSRGERDRGGREGR